MVKVRHPAPRGFGARDRIIKGIWDFETLRIIDTGGTDFVTFTHDGSDFNIAATQTLDINLTGYTGAFRFPTGTQGMTLDGNNGRFQAQATAIIADDATVTVTGTNGIVRGMWLIMDDGNQETRYGLVVIDEATALVSISLGSACVAGTANPDTDTKMNIFISGGGISIKNRLGFSTSFTMWQFGI